MPMWREVFDVDLWRIKEYDSLFELRERWKMIQAKVDRVCYDVESNLNKFERLSSSKGETEILRGEPSAVEQ